ncbi:MAG: amidohydrolase family protein [Lutibacter sp.]
MKKQTIYSLLFLFLSITISAQQTPAPKQTADYSIEGATAHLGNGEIIENSLIMFSNGKLVFVGSALMKIARMGEVTNATGKHVYPGFILANSSLGLGEIDAVRATLDANEIGEMIPHVKSLIAYNAESKVVESVRPNGVLMAQITPRGSIVSGTSSIVQLDAWNWEDAAIKANDGIHVNWPQSFSAGRPWSGEEEGIKPNKDYLKEVEKIVSFIRNGKNYLNSAKSPKNLPYEALEGLFNGSQNLYVHANGIKEITDAINFSKEMGISKLVIVNGNDAYKVADLLASNKIPVIIERAHRLPNSVDDDYDLPYKTAKLLTEKGVVVAIGMEGGMERMNSRNLPFYAGTCAAYGLDKEEALKLITSNAAKILGIDDFVGTLEVGKDATLFVSEGDALDMRTNRLTDAFIQGRKISLETHQTELWQRYDKKYSSQE